MSNPIKPNYNPGSGSRLAVDRYDFKNHVDGYNSKHKALFIDLDPTIIIDGIAYSNVQEAIKALSTVVVPSFTVPDATPVNKGIIQLSISGDIGGTATLVRVTRLQGNSVSPAIPSIGQVLQWNGSSWAPTTPSNTFSASGDLSGNNTSQTVIGLQGRAVANLSPSNKNVLTWIAGNNRWEPASLSPSGTGFVTTTSGNFDSSSTANIRYTGGKFQTDANIQFKNGNITGDLVWAPTTINKTLTLPNATDTLVGLSTTDTLSNKTISVSTNTITDSGIQSGDLLISNGTKFIRLSKGTDGSFLGVQAGVVGYYTPSNSTPSGTGFVTVTSGVYDPVATTNIRYTGTKFQTDTSIQFKTGNFNGDLAWSVSGDRTLTLPDATDTLVGQATADSLTNKNINVSNNTLTATSQAVGDLLKNNGSSFVRFAKGNALQILRVKSDGTDLEWANIAMNGSAGAATTVQTSDGAGGFSAATNVLAGSSFVSIDSPASTTGSIRLSNTGSVTFRNAANSADVYVYQTDNTSSINLGSSSSGTSQAFDLKLRPSNSVTMNVGGQSGLTVAVNGAVTGANASFFGAGNFFSNQSGSIFIGDSGLAPPSTTVPNGGGFLYSEAGALKWKGSSGTYTTIAPSDPHCKQCGRDFTLEWSNSFYDEYLMTCIPCLLEALSSIGIKVDRFSERKLHQ